MLIGGIDPGGLGSGALLLHYFKGNTKMIIVPELVGKLSYAIWEDNLAGCILVLQEIQGVYEKKEYKNEN